jgi:hypothetical protein
VLGKRAAVDAMASHVAGRLPTLPNYPAWKQWVRVGRALGLLERDRPLSLGEMDVFIRAYRTELRRLAGLRLEVVR